MRFLHEINTMAQKNKRKLLTKIKKLKNKVRFRRKCDNYSSPLRLQLVRYLQSVFQSSTTHGLPYIVNNRLHYLEKAFWVANVVVCFTIMIALLTLQYFRFVAAPTVMSVERNYFDWNISYPTITLCPLYKPDGIKLGKFINDTNEKSGLNVKAYVWAITQAALDTLDFIDLDPPNEQQLTIDPKNYAEVAATLFRNFDKDWLASKGDQAISVDAAMTEMGMCHVINSNVAIFDQPQNWNSAAIAAETYVKKNIDLSIFEADFFTVITDYESVYKVFIHGPDEVTMTTGSWFIFDVEGLISFGLSVWSTRISEELRYKSLRLRKCRFTHEPISKRYPVYSFNHCILECRIKMILRICGCIPHFYKPMNNERICYISELKCILKHRKEMITLRTSEETLKNFCNTKDLPKISRDCGCLNSCELDLYYKDDEDFLPQKGLNKLKIKITSFPKVRVVRDVIFSFYDIVLKSGGVMNLCIGSSLISLVELILVIVKCIISFKLYLDQFIEI